MQKIVQYFDNMRMVIDKFGLSYARRFARTIRSGGGQGDEKKLGLVFGQHQALVSIQTVSPQGPNTDHIQLRPSVRQFCNYAASLRC